jgi:hypothetical protein
MGVIAGILNPKGLCKVRVKFDLKQSTHSLVVPWVPGILGLLTQNRSDRGARGFGAKIDGCCLPTALVGPECLWVKMRTRKCEQVSSIQSGVDRPIHMPERPRRQTDRTVNFKADG